MNKAIIRDANVYHNGQSTHGFAKEIALPEINPTKSDYSALGMIGTSKVFKGFDAMEMSIKWSAPEDNIITSSMNPFSNVDLMIRASREVSDATGVVDQQPVAYYVKGSPAGGTFGTLKQKEDNELETKIDITYFKMVQNGKVLFELDIENNIYIVDGVDLLQDYRNNLGL